MNLQKREMQEREAPRRHDPENHVCWLAPNPQKKKSHINSLVMFHNSCFIEMECINTFQMSLN